MYPTVVIILVQTQRSATDICEISPSSASRLAGPVTSTARLTTLGYLSFAVGTVHSSTDNETQPQHSRALQSQGGQAYDLDGVILEENKSHAGTSG